LVSALNTVLKAELMHHTNNSDGKKADAELAGKHSKEGQEHMAACRFNRMDKQALRSVWVRTSGTSLFLFFLLFFSFFRRGIFAGGFFTIPQLIETAIGGGGGAVPDHVQRVMGM
jgi:hypothetical protein